MCVCVCARARARIMQVESVLSTVQAMAASKMNVLHWHMVDAPSFPLHLRSAPKLARHGAYSPLHVNKSLSPWRHLKPWALRLAQHAHFLVRVNITITIAVTITITVTVTIAVVCVCVCGDIRASSPPPVPRPDIRESGDMW